VFDTGLAAVLDTLETAMALSSPEGRRMAAVTVASTRRRVRTHQGFTVPVVPLPRARPDVVVVPALGCKTPETVGAALARADVADGCAALVDWSRGGALVTAACTATFVLGAAGLLDGRSATTTWWLAPFFRERFPRARLDETRMIVESSRVVTAGTALAHVDLALWLVRRRSPVLARAVARHLLYDARPSQAVYIMPDYLAHADPLVEKFEAWARQHLVDFSLSRAARAVGASERTLERRVRAVLGISPLSYVRDLRVERAIHRLQTTDDSLDDIAAAVGYGDGVTLRALLRQRTGRGVRELRRLWGPS
jgi:transcriptional regulator GlxA family with amidase domain